MITSAELKKILYVVFRDAFVEYLASEKVTDSNYYPLPGQCQKTPRRRLIGVSEPLSLKADLREQTKSARAYPSPF